MKIFVLDMGWQGAILCLAESKDEAWEKMISSGKLDRPYGRLDEYELSEVIETQGDR